MAGLACSPFVPAKAGPTLDSRLRGNERSGAVLPDFAALIRATLAHWLDLQSQYDIAMVVREKGAEIAKRVRPADAA